MTMSLDCLANSHGWLGHLEVLVTHQFLLLALSEALLYKHLLLSHVWFLQGAFFLRFLTCYWNFDALGILASRVSNIQVDGLIVVVFDIKVLLFRPLEASGLSSLLFRPSFWRLHVALNSWINPLTLLRLFVTSTLRLTRLFESYNSFL